MSIENTTTPITVTTFSSLKLHPLILAAVEDSGYTVPSPIQAEAIPEVMAGHDLLASAQTGTGKTAAFILPALHRIAEPPSVRSKGPRVLVLTPTRELAQQVSEAATKYGKNMRLKVVSILGGMPYPLQNKLLSNPVDILVATPGRLIDHIERGRIDFSRLEMLVLDEADRMLDMGFIDDVERIAAATPATRQTLLFSATMDGVITNLAKQLLTDPKRISIAPMQARHEHIEQRLMYVDDMAHKGRLLDHLLRDANLNQAVVFTATKRDADTLADQLLSQGHSAAALHGDMNQRERNRTLVNLRRGQVRILVATDVAARGIDVPGISHVINFDLPKAAEDYVHRIGRTGRAGSSGIAVSFASNRDTGNLQKIERYTGQSLSTHIVAGLEPKFKPRSHSPGTRSKPGGFGRHTPTDRQHAHPGHARREGQPTARFGNGAPRRNGNTGTAGQERRSTSGFSQGRGYNSGNR
ncbi:DEAD/DEAH box helicase [Candidatus Nitrotoga fabula]|uniref:DEAD-box ATP-dependent RNA helicase RhpA n=1 Tax=Candidatus Nitrotoga fabula TaxID=2182327 RepID=A0A916F945_9PROT|nr:DEAD/DEAH box helicase [Candidatus Nitrotoga fabula]CAE6698843.1 ATP-dependent RNA helicase SrmB [Candidatus Nitrotoga fabula]